MKKKSDKESSRVYNTNNLLKAEKMTPEQRRERASKAGKASARKKKERKKLKEELLLLLGSDDCNKKICTALVQKAMNGDTTAFSIIRDTIGEKPITKVETTEYKKLEDVL